MPAGNFCSSKVALSMLLGTFMLLLYTISPANSAFVCERCEPNYYCQGGQRYACTGDTVSPAGSKNSDACVSCLDLYGEGAPVYQGSACLSCFEAGENETWANGSCTTCVEANQTANASLPDDEKKVMHDPINDECVTCGEANPSTPLWDGSKCVSCDGEKMVWTENHNCSCEEGYFADYSVAVLKPDGTEAYRLSPDMIFKPTPVSYSTCTAMVADNKYPEVTACWDWATTVYSYLGTQDCWAGAVKYCRDQGKRLPTKQELAYLAQTIYGDTTITAVEYNKNNLTIANQELIGIALTGDDTFTYFWSADEEVAYHGGSSYYCGFSATSAHGQHCARNYTSHMAFCLDD